MENKNKYLLGALLGTVALGVVVAAAVRFGPKMRARMQQRCRRMIEQFSRDEAKEEEEQREPTLG